MDVAINFPVAIVRLKSGMRLLNGDGTVVHYPAPNEHPLFSPRQPTAAPPQPDPDDHHSECGPPAPNQRHLHNLQHRIPRHHHHRGLRTLSGGGHTITIPTPLSVRTHASEKHGHKCIPTLLANSSPPTFPGLGSANRRQEVGRQSQRGDLHPN
jgi:hypothetical protein